MLHKVQISLNLEQESPLQKYLLSHQIRWEKEHLVEWLTVDMAHVVMLHAKGIVSKNDAAKNLKTLVALRQDGTDVVNHKGLLLIGIIEEIMANRIGASAAGILRIGRSQLDHIPTVARLSARHKFLEVMANMIDVEEALLSFAKKYQDVLVPYHTHGQYSQPGTVGHFMLAHLFRIGQDFKLCQHMFAELNKCPLGSTGRCGTPWGIDRFMTAELLGFDEPIRHSILGREPDWAMNTAAALARVTTSLGQLATDIHFWLSSDIRYADINRSHCSGSSIFAHKKNPQTTDKIRIYAGEAAHWYGIALSTCRGMGTGDHFIRQIPELETWIDKTNQATLSAIGQERKVRPYASGGLRYRGEIGHSSRAE
ncbi:hypothetical protein O181_011466 [Austropuccinia psidii MF-1]|uniref:Arginosuccinase n=1 Tax=Austropuccinia psidii MF-1 TaxID=1389203 RepID=A0A9Q3BSV3_9BASI|nr:hypothetical protein [Austropuccinia psidii MF-1]